MGRFSIAEVAWQPEWYEAKEQIDMVFYWAGKMLENTPSQQYRSVALYSRLSIFVIDSNQENRHKHR
jgi:hypothetical protein